MSSASLDNVTVIGESVLREQMDSEDSSLDRLHLMLFLMMGCTSWVAWKIFMKFLKFPEQPKCGAWFIPILNKNFNQKNNPNLKNALLPGGVLNKVNKSAAGTSDQMVVNLPNFPNVQLSNQNLSISLPGMTTSIIPPITSSVMTNHNVLSTWSMHGHHVQNIPNDSLMNQTVATMENNSHMVSRGQPSHQVHSVTVNQNPEARLQSIAGIPVNCMNRQTNLLANGGTAAGNVDNYQYSSNAAGISTSQVVIHQQRGISAMPSNRFASLGGSTRELNNITGMLTGPYRS